MENIETFTTYLSKKEQLLDEMLKSILVLSKQSSQSFKVMGESAQTVQASAQSFQELSKVLLVELQKGTYNPNESFEQLNQALNSLDKTLIQTQQLVESLKESPSDLFFKQNNIKYGPGE